MTTPRIGFCCKWIDPSTSLDKKARLASESTMNQKATTLTALRKLTTSEQLDRIVGLVDVNVATLWRQLQWISEQPQELRLFRLTSEFIPANTAPGFEDLLDQPRLLASLSKLSGVRDFASKHGIRLCTHPGQFTNICSDNPDVVDRAVEDLNYHGRLAAAMGYGDTWHSDGYAINIHANVRQDPDLKQFIDVVNNRVDSTVRNLITLENDEFGCSVDDIVASDVADHVALVMDIHHHWVESGGEYIQPDDSRCRVFERSWRGQRPLGHFSTSSEILLNGHDPLVRPDFKMLLSGGHKPGKLRAHSDLCWNQDVNSWALSHLTWTDLEVEAKGKNLASRGLYEQYREQAAIS